MPTHLRFPRARSAGTMLAAGLALAALPAGASASAVGLGRSAPFVVLGGSAVTNTGPSVLNGDLGVAPGTSLVGFASPAVVNGVTHDDDAVAAAAQHDLTTAYGVAAGQPVTANLTGQDLGGQTLTPGAYKHSSSAQLTGQLTLDAEGNPNAQFVFEIGTTLTTASGSSVRLINGASPCNVFWQVGSSATLGTTTAFTGTVMALTSITLDHAATVRGRMLARNGAVTLDDNVLTAGGCTAGSTSTSTSTTTSGGDGTSTTPGETGAGTTSTSTAGEQAGDGTRARTHQGTAKLFSRTRLTARQGVRKGPRVGPRRRRLHGCTTGFRAEVHGRRIRRVVFRIGGKRIASRTKHLRVYVRPQAGSRGRLIARISFRDRTHAKTLGFAYRACAAAKLHPAVGPSQFTG